MKYLQSGLFEYSQGGSDSYCANITLVLRNQIKEQRCETKADKNLLKQQKNEPITKLETQPLQSDTSDNSGKLSTENSEINLSIKLLLKKTFEMIIIYHLCENILSHPNPI